MKGLNVNHQHYKYFFLIRIGDIVHFVFQTDS